MKLETLNTWGGRIYDPLMDHIFRQAHDNIDVFCFQEVCDTPGERAHTRSLTADQHNSPINDTYPARADLYKQLGRALPDFAGFYRSTQDGIDFTGPVSYPLHFGLATFVRKTKRVAAEDDFFVFGSRNSQIGNDCATMGRNLQYTQLVHKERLITIAHLHGLWHPHGKGDTPERLTQSYRIIKFLGRLGGDLILGGDLNLLPGSQSIKILEQHGLRNMITEYGVESTRSSLYQKPIKFGSYIFTSPGIDVRNFRVIPEDISDHLALELEFE